MIEPSRAPLQPPCDFTVLVLDNAYAAGVASTLAMLSEARRLAPGLSAPVPTWRVTSVSGGTVPLDNGMYVTTTPLPAATEARASTWIVPGMGLDSPSDIRTYLGRPTVQVAIATLRDHARGGGAVAAACSGVFVLQAAGLLARRRVTTAWWLARELQRVAPDCRVDAARMVCADGAVTTAGAAFAQQDLMLHLLRTRCGQALADALSRALLIDGRQAQASAAVPEVYASGDELVGRLTTRVEAALPNLPSVGELARAFCMSERTLARHVKRATGASPLALMQSIRQRRARALLESSRLTVEQVANAVGYQDPTALRRLMRRVGGASPSQFRAPAVGDGAVVP